MTHQIKNVVVAGAGVMGRGIAQVFAQAGFETILVDTSPAQLERAMAQIKESLGKFAAKGKITPDQERETLARLHLQNSLTAQPCDLFIEAVFEELEVKKALLQKADGLFGPHTILASNTSGLSITQMAAATHRPDRVIGLHFFNPVPIMKLLEIVVGEKTSDETLQIAQSLADLLQKEAITVKDRPGFATSRLGICLAFEAIRMLEEGVASAEDIDRAMVLGYGHPMGPLRLTDLVGLDVRLAIGEHLNRSLGGTRFEPPALLRQYVNEGRLGQKSGQGFYTFSPPSKA